MRWERAAKDALLERFFDEEEGEEVSSGGEGGHDAQYSAREGGRGGGGGGGGGGADDERRRRAEWERQRELKERAEARESLEAARVVVEAHERAMQARRTPPGEVGQGSNHDQEDVQRTPTQQAPYPAPATPAQVLTASHLPQASTAPPIPQALAAALPTAFKEALLALPTDVLKDRLRSLPPQESAVLQQQLWGPPKYWLSMGEEAVRSVADETVQSPRRTQEQEPQQQQPLDHVMESPPRQSASSAERQLEPLPQAQLPPQQADPSTQQQPVPPLQQQVFGTQLQHLHTQSLQHQNALPLHQDVHASRSQLQQPASSPSNQHVDSSTHRTSPVTTT
ncbi:hypothetical protein K523DRAFT_322144 [Schizophyllum commune Tattone D]|nr:hypothetical protein K523DRAFT_322144 [Schizophyllum commune Tattone D]